jgi:hypothetical protein
MVFRRSSSIAPIARLILAMFLVISSCQRTAGGVAVDVARFETGKPLVYLRFPQIIIKGLPESIPTVSAAVFPNRKQYFTHSVPWGQPSH